MPDTKPTPTPPSSPPASAPKPPAPSDPGHFSIGGRRVSYDALFIAGGGLLGAWFLLKGQGHGSLGAAAAAPMYTSGGGGLAGAPGLSTASLAPPPSGGGPTPAPADFATPLYTQYLNRAPDTTGQAYWDTLAATQGAPAATTAFLSTPEAAIQQDYQRYLGRYADQPGLNYWLGQAQGGESLAQIQAAFAASPEARTYATHTV